LEEHLRNLDRAMHFTRQILFQKGSQRYVFRYGVGRESEIVETFASMAAKHGEGLDWLDASLLSYQVGRRFAIDTDSADRIPRSRFGQVSPIYGPCD
jgi:hypothetical protein